MIPLVLLLLGAGAFAAYEFSSKTHNWVDEHAKSIKDALAAHRVADEHLAVADAHAESASAVASVAPVSPVAPGPAESADPWDHKASFVPETASAFIDAGIQHVKAAMDARDAAAHHTTKAAQTVPADPHHQAVVAKSASDVIDLQAKIRAALQKLGSGDCGVRHYTKVSATVKDALIAKLRADGMVVTGAGANQWTIDSHITGIGTSVKLGALWDQTAQTLYLIVTAGSGFGVICTQIWAKIEPSLQGVIAKPSAIAGRRMSTWAVREHKELMDLFRETVAVVDNAYLAIGQWVGVLPDAGSAQRVAAAPERYQWWLNIASPTFKVWDDLKADPSWDALKDFMSDLKQIVSTAHAMGMPEERVREVDPRNPFMHKR